ncbi:hypothetical protein CNX65_07970 [Actinosynnema pretiosum]|uniref:Uncharacterized protein n=1 Tax=Actinosynnema pretiosum TaxID=42197 RepID=A0A290ZGB8_9PSEU|nr:hypothetical protein CNX65_07970 [Actinosynnema pretiosum]
METIKSMTANMTSLKQSAASGGFAITESGADAYIQAINNALDSLGSMMFNVQILNQETKLGTSPDAIAMSRYNLENVQGGPGTIGLLPAIQELIKALTEAREAMEQAKQNYQSVDQSNQMNYPQ